MSNSQRTAKTTINLRKSIATDFIPEIVNKLALATDAVIFPPPGANPALPVANNGIERNGGVTNMYLQNITYGDTASYGVSTGFNYPTQDGHLLSLNNASSIANVLIDRKNLGQVSSYGVALRSAISSADDVLLTTGGTYLTAKLIGSTITLSEYNTSGILLNTRSVSFTLLTSLSTSFVSLNFVRTSTPAFSQNQEYIVKIGNVGYILKEASPTSVQLKLGNLTSYYLTSSIVYGNYAVFGTADGRMLSIDYNGNYKFPDGSGTGLGPFAQIGSINGSTAFVPVSITSLVTNGNMLITGDSVGRISSWDGANWKYYSGNGVGTGIYNNQSVVSTNKITSMTKYVKSGSDSYIVVTGGNTLGYWSYTTSSWVSSGGFTISASNTAAVINSQTINTSTSITYSGTNYLIVGCVTGLVASYNASAWLNYNASNHGTTALCASTGDVVSTQNITAAASYAYGGNTYYVIGAVTGILASFQFGTGWTAYNHSGTGINVIAANQNIVGSVTITGLTVQGSNLYAIGGSAAKYAIWNGTVWTGASSLVEGYYNASLATGGQNITSSVQFSTYYVVGTASGRIASFDGTHWKNWDGSGLGTGPYNSGTAVNGQSIIKLLVFGTKLVVVSINYVANWNGTFWTNYDGSGAAVQPYNNNTATSGYGFKDACIFGSTIAFVGSYYNVTNISLPPTYYYFQHYFYVASFDGTNWKNSDGSGTGIGINLAIQGADATFILSTQCTVFGNGPTNNGTVTTGLKCGVVGSQFVFYATSQTNYSDKIIEINSYDGSNWKYSYAPNQAAGVLTGGTGTGLFGYYWHSGGTTYSGGNIGTNAVYTLTVSSLASWNSKLVIAGTDGSSNTIISSYDGSNWKYQDGTGTGTGPYYSGTALLGSGTPIVAITDYIPAATHFMIVGSTSANGISSWDGSNWKNSDGTGTGTGPYNIGTAWNSQNVGALTSYNTTYLMVGSNGGYVASWNNSAWAFYNTSIPPSVAYSLGLGVANTAIVYAPSNNTNITNLLFSGGSNTIFSYNYNTQLFENVYNKKNAPQIYFGVAGLPSHEPTIALECGKYLVYIYNGSEIYSFDGTDWRGASSTSSTFGNGSGPWSSNGYNCYGDSNVFQSTAFSALANSQNSSTYITCAAYWNNYLVVGGVGGVIGCYNFSTKTWYSGVDTNAHNTGQVATDATTNSPASVVNSGVMNAMTPYSATPSGVTSLVFLASVSTTNTYIASVSGSNGSVSWLKYNGTGAGTTGLCANSNFQGNAYGINSICLTVYTQNNGANALCVGSAGGYVNVYNSATSTANQWENWNISGAGTTHTAVNQNVLSSSNIISMCQHPYVNSNGQNVNALVIGSQFGAIASWDGQYWVKGDGTAGGTAPLGPWNNNGTSCGMGLVGGTSYGTQSASYSAIVNQVQSLVSYCGILYAVDIQGNVASFNGSAVSNWWTTYQGLGGTTYNSTSVIQQGTSTATVYMPPVIYNGILQYLSIYSPLTIINQTAKFPSASTNSVITLPESFLNQVFAYKFENNSYLIGITNNTQSIFYGIDTFGEVTLVNAQYALAQISSGKSRMLITGLPQYYYNLGYQGLSNQVSINNWQLQSIGLFGYTDFTNYTSYVLYPSASYVPNSIFGPNIGLGYADFIFGQPNTLVTTAAYQNNWWNFYAPNFTQTQTALYNVVQSNNLNYSVIPTIMSNGTPQNQAFGQHPLLNAYGKITNAYGLSPASPFEFREVWAGGNQSILSVAITGDGGLNDNLGSALTNLGEIDEGYIPHTMNDNTIVYKYQGQPVIIQISKSIAQPFQQIGGSLYKIGTISPFNIVDTSNGTLNIGSCDYNGRIIWNNTSASSTTGAVYVANQFNGKYSNSFDVGSKAVYISNPSFTNITLVPGIRLPYTPVVVNNYEIDNYTATSAITKPVYAYSIESDGSILIDPLKTGIQYIQNTIIPLALGYTYRAFSASTSIETVFMATNLLLLNTIYNTVQFYDGYQTGNTVSAGYTIFFLRGNEYIFDGANIYQPIFSSSGFYSSKNFITYANGMKYIGAGPIFAYFLSSFDNAIYTFDGGQVLQKLARFSRPDIDTIINGMSSTLNNELLLQTATKLIWIRDNVVTMQNKSALQTSLTLTLYDTSNGIVIQGATQQWIYSFYQLSGSVVVPLNYQSAFIGIGDDIKMDIDQWMLTFYDPAKIKRVITLTQNGFDQDADYSETKVFNIQSSMYTANGVIRLPFKPQNTRLLGASMNVSTDTNKVYFNELVLLSGEDTEARKIDFSNPRV
jgi:hypothetical protein